MSLLNTPGLSLLARVLEVLDRAFKRGGRWQFGPRSYAGLLLFFLARTQLSSVLRSPHGLLLPKSRRGGRHPRGRRTVLAPREFVTAMAGLGRHPDPRSNEYPLLLITGERERCKVNTRLWYQPLLARMHAAPFARLNRSDAEGANIQNGDEVVVSTSTGSFRIKALVGNEVMPGVISIPHGWGRRFHKPGPDGDSAWGENVNRLTDDAEKEPLTGMPVFNGIACRVEKAEDAQLAPAM